jgi:hypothetical protein
MKLLKKLTAVTLTAFALGCGTASASVIEHVHLGLQSGATFNGDFTFADHYTSILGVDGYLVGHNSSNSLFDYGNDHITWSFDAYYNGTQDDGSHGTGIAGVLTDYLTDGDPRDTYINYLGISWYAPADSLTIDIDSAVATSYAGVNAGDRIVSVTVGAPVTPPSTDVPEPASLILLGLGLGGLATARRRRA